MVVPLGWNDRQNDEQRDDHPTTTAAATAATTAATTRRAVATVSSPSDRAEMGYAARMRFEPGDLALLAETVEIEIETAAPGGSSHRTIVWVVVDGEDAFVRSVRGTGARWYREAVANPVVTIHIADRILSARAVTAADPVSVRRTSDALAHKYPGDPGTPPMLRPEVLDATLRLTPS